MLTPDTVPALLRPEKRVVPLLSIIVILLVVELPAAVARKFAILSAVSSLIVLFVSTTTLTDFSAVVA